MEENAKTYVFDSGKSDNLLSGMLMGAGFGNGGFGGFGTNSIGDLIALARWIASRFCEFSKMNEEDVLGKIIFNLKMTWLNLSVYNATDYIGENGMSLLVNMIDDIHRNKDSYKYKGKYTLESFYGMLIK